MEEYKQTIEEVKKVTEADPEYWVVFTRSG